MPSKPLALALLVATCVVAAAGGAYIATRQNAASIPATAPAQAVSATAAAGTEGSATPAATSTPPVTPDTQAVQPSKPGAVGPSIVRRAPVGSIRPAAPAPKADPEPPVAAKNEGLQDTGVGAQPKPWPNSGGTAVGRGTPQPPITLPPPVEATPVRDSQDQNPPAKEIEELVVPTDAVLGLQLQTSLSSERAQIEDAVDARITRDVRVGNRVAIPAGTRVIGSVVMVGRGGKVKERASLAIKFHTVVLADSTRLAINTDAIYREGDSPASKSAAKIGGAAVGGAILGGLLGGGKGAAIGSTIGAASGTTAVMAGDRATVVLPVGTLLTVRMLAPVTVTVEK